VAGDDGFTWAHASCSSIRDGAVGCTATAEGAAFSFWPLPLNLDSGELLTLELRGDPAGISNDRSVGSVSLSISELVRQHPQLLLQELLQLRVQVPLHRPAVPAGSPAAGVEQEQAGAAEAAAAALVGQADAEDGEAAESSDGGIERGNAAEEAATVANSVVEDDCDCSAGDSAGQPAAAAPSAASNGGQATVVAPAAVISGPPGGSGFGQSLLSAANAVSNAAVKAVDAVVIPTAALLGIGTGPSGGATLAAAAAAAAAAGTPTLCLTVRLEAVGELQAAVAAGMAPAAAQTCLAMLAEPGGLYLDVKSAYSNPRDLQVWSSACLACSCPSCSAAVCMALCPLLARIPIHVSSVWRLLRPQTSLAPACSCLPLPARLWLPALAACCLAPADVREHVEGGGHPLQCGVQLPAEAAAGVVQYGAVQYGAGHTVHASHCAAAARFVRGYSGLQLRLRPLCLLCVQIPPTIAPNVLFFHGVSGLENACDAGQIAPGQCVLFNGASFLADLSHGGLQASAGAGLGLGEGRNGASGVQMEGRLCAACMLDLHAWPPVHPPFEPLTLPTIYPPTHPLQLPEDRAAELLGGAEAYPLDSLVVRRYKGLVEQYGFAGGIYVQVGRGRPGQLRWYC
jgi:hypothetical protein